MNVRQQSSRQSQKKTPVLFAFVGSDFNSFYVLHVSRFELGCMPCLDTPCSVQHRSMTLACKGGNWCTFYKKRTFRRRNKNKKNRTWTRTICLSPSYTQACNHPITQKYQIAGLLCAVAIEMYYSIRDDKIGRSAALCNIRENENGLR